jgi:nitrite reductase/ring-hydroxylating ferredoxin subunit
MEERLRDDFPVDWEEDHYVSRREFFKFMTLASGGLAIGTGALAVVANLPREAIRFEPSLIARTGDLARGKALAFSYPRPKDLCLLVMKEDGSLAAFTRRCTHLSCPVEWEPDRNRLFCPCHNGAFSIETGEVLQGPPPHPLPKVRLEVRGDEIWATGVVKTHEEEA